MAYSLVFSDVDCSGGSIQKTWRSKPTEKQLRVYVEGYYDDETTQTLIDDLLSTGEKHMNNGECTVWSLQQG